MTSAGSLATRLPAPEGSGSAAKTGLYFLLAVITSLFSLLLIALLVRAQYSDWEPLTQPWQPLASLRPLWANTMLLFAASLALQWACHSARNGDLKRTLGRALWSGVFCGGFVIGQLRVWSLLLDHGIGVGGNPANSFFYLLTGLHGLHIIGGLVAWAYVLLRSHRMNAGQLQQQLELCARYWHYLLVVWLVLFAALSCSPETYRSIAAFCGF